MIFESQNTLNQCKDQITVCWGVGKIFTQSAMFEIHPIPFLSKCKIVQRAVSLCKLMLVFSLLIFPSRFVGQSHAQLFVEIYIRACDKLAFFSKYARAHVRTCARAGSYVPGSPKEFSSKCPICFLRALSYMYTHFCK